MVYRLWKGSLPYDPPVAPDPQVLTYHNIAFLTGEGGDGLTPSGPSRPVVG